MPQQDDRWLLPDGVEETLPEEARRVERLRRRALDLLDSWGYELVMPPLMEYLDSLLTGVGRGLEIETFKITDQLSGKMMGVRADMTPQVARIDAHYLRRGGPNRLCYFGPVLRTRPDCLGCSRVPLQLGAELFGVDDPSGDVEIVELLVETLRMIGLADLHVDLGHMGLFNGLADDARLEQTIRSQLNEAIRRKALPAVRALCTAAGISPDLTRCYEALATGSGDVSTLAGLAKVFDHAPAATRTAFDNLQQIASRLQHRLAGVRLYFDLAAEQGQSYHNGLLFSVFVPGHGRAVAAGGRYDGIGTDFGRARPATGFSLDLRIMARLVGSGADSVEARICAPYDENEALMRKVSELRAAGRRVVFCHAADAEAGDGEAATRLVERDGEWIIE